MGGAGKTRLALEAASHQVGAWPGGVWLVDLMPLSDPGHVPGAVARTLGVADRPDVTPLAGLVDHLRTMELLLVVDNCEHLAEACADADARDPPRVRERSRARHEPRRARHSGRDSTMPSRRWRLPEEEGRVRPTRSNEFSVGSSCSSNAGAR